MTTTRIKRIAPLQLGKVLAILYGLLGLVFIPFLLVFTLFGAAAGGQHNPAGMALGIGMGLGMVIVLPLMYAFFGFIGGLLSGFIYNLVAGWVGGIEIELE